MAIGNIFLFFTLDASVETENTFVVTFVTNYVTLRQVCLQEYLAAKQSTVFQARTFCTSLPGCS